MEMIAMLGGLGAAGPYIENPSQAATAARGLISKASTLVEIDSIIAGLPQMGLSAQELAVLQAFATDRRIDISTPFYKRPSYWVKVAAVVGVAYLFWPKIKQVVGLNGWSRMNPHYDFAAGKEKAKRMSDDALHYAILDIKKTLPASRSLDREDGGDREGWYMDEASVYQSEILRRRNEKGLSGLALPKSVEGVDKQGRKVRMTVKKDRDFGEWMVRVYVDGKFNENETYFGGQDKSDTIETFEDMKKTYGLAGLGAGWGSSDKHKINPGSRKGTAANPKAGYSRSFDPYAKEKELIGRMDDARYHARKKAKGLRRKARTEARKAGK